MNQYNNSNYISLFNQKIGEIESIPNSVIVSNNDNNITSTRNINNNIDNLSIDINKINASGTPSNLTYLRGDGTWSIVSSSANEFEYDNTGLSVNPFASIMTIDLYKFYGHRIGNITFVNFRITFSSGSTSANSLGFSVSGLPNMSTSYNEFVPGSLSCGKNVTWPLLATDITKSVGIITCLYTFTNSFVNVDGHLYGCFSYKE